MKVLIVVVVFASLLTLTGCLFSAEKLIIKEHPYESAQNQA